MNQMALLKELLKTASSKGWAQTTGLPWSNNSIERLVGPLWYLPPSLRDREPTIDILKPTSRTEAYPNSLSAKHGTGQQPPHTDGAHHQVPPDIVLLYSERASAVPTLLWHLSDIPEGTQYELREGIFTVRTGKYSFLAHALEGFYDARLRYDPGCMSPADGRAQRATEVINSLHEAATAFHWSTPGTVLAINNRQMLHARGDATEEPERKLERVALRVKGNFK